MLRNMSSVCNTVPMPQLDKTPDTWSRNEKDDMKLAIEYLYELYEKLCKLHPECKIHIHNMLQEQRRY